MKITITGGPKTGKTWMALLLKRVFRSWGIECLFTPMDLTPKQVGDREYFIDAMCNPIPEAKLCDVLRGRGPIKIETVQGPRLDPDLTLGDRGFPFKLTCDLSPVHEWVETFAGAKMSNSEREALGYLIGETFTRSSSFDDVTRLALAKEFKAMLRDPDVDKA